MSSRKLLALDFIKRYFAQWGCSPTLGELAAELGVSNKRAHDLVHALAQAQMIEHAAGQTRGIRLINKSEELSETDVLLRLAASGWTIAYGDKMLVPAEAASQPPAAVAAALAKALTEKGLPDLPELDHDPDEPAAGCGTYEAGARAGAAEARPGFEKSAAAGGRRAG
ncbi:MAG TPA: hypothetical protein VNH53_03880 [Sphingomicrobium sp.]|nr:hypothetical protein [Sphingomicrobium sp.]